MTNPNRHGGGHVHPPVEALLDPDPELWLTWAPLAPDMGSCKYEACESDEVCTCQLPEPWTEAQLDSIRRLRYE